ncbi:MAG TPA: hypothetical protein VM511_01820 [Luteolibacter sp.]|jgi:hypothetical protein|nr:hypothetical protein [Luteolibacter sp.]
MKALLTLLPVVMTTLASAGPLVLAEWSQENNGVVTRKVQHLADEDSLAKLKGWKPGEGVPVPVTRDRAVELAKEAARLDGRTEFKELETSVQLTEAMLFDEDTGEEIRVRKGTCLWYYMISFVKSGKFEDQYVVSMDGKVALRVIQ